MKEVVTIDESTCIVCGQSVNEVAKAGYITTAGVGIVGHWSCLEALNNEIVSNRNKAMRKSETQPTTVQTRPIDADNAQQLLETFYKAGYNAGRQDSEK